ncbi:hypothetical protein FAdVDgp25 [Fowl aviadenovirus D]|uniref:Uncharacterized protein RTL5 n=1 Tax=Avian adenovirus 8 (strain ATCC A-2A) TaxID=66295 RepID=Q9YYQ0_ADEG8|nr:hypothetical protein FAdVDgp25 [Fowl aviadenovirus D]AAC71679.1 unknown [Fowl aviadenovirus 8]
MINPIDVIKLIVNSTWKIPSSIFLVCFRVRNVKRKIIFMTYRLFQFVRKSQDNVRFILFCEVFLRISVLSLTIYSFYLGLYLEVIFYDRKYTVYSVELWKGLS